MYQSGVHRPVLSSVDDSQASPEHPCSAGVSQQNATQDNTNENRFSLLWEQEAGSSSLLSPTISPAATSPQLALIVHEFVVV